MNRKILFSPVGGTDPMPEKNDYDGAMLHICRVYKVDKVYLYMSQEILKKHEQDNRYIYCLNGLSRIINKEIEYEMIKRGNLVNVHDFDYFYDDFNNILKSICDELDDTDELLINVTSGTAAMMSALVVLAALQNIRCRCIQVTTPNKSMNDHVHSEDYMVEERWECNEDNIPDFTNRTVELKSRPLITITNEKIIKEHIRSYDYHAARTVAAGMPEYETSKYKPLIEIAYERYLLNSKGVSKLIRENNIDESKIFPVMSGEWRAIFEYALTLDIRRKRHEYGDFVRTISPVIFEMFNKILEKYEKFELEKYTYKNKSGAKKWDKNKLKPEYAQYLENAYNGKFDYNGFVKSDHLKAILINCKSVSKHLEIIKLVTELRDIEENVRNLAAHEITCITDDIVVQKTKYNCEQIMNKIKKAFTYTTANIKEKDWNIYDVMNDEITARMNY